MSKIIFIYAILTTFFASFLPSNVLSQTDCSRLGDGIYSNISIDQIFDTFETLGHGGADVSEGLSGRGDRYFANPVSQLLIAISYIQEGDMESALGHLDIASYLAQRDQICERSLVDEIILIARKEAVEGILEGYPKQLYFSLTEGLLLSELGLFSNQFPELIECMDARLFSQNSSQNICQ